MTNSMVQDKKKEVYINNLLLPKELVELISMKKHNYAKDVSKLYSFMFDIENPRLEIWPLDLIMTENKSWTNQTDPMFVGTLDLVDKPGIIDPQQSILFGDFGIGSDQPVALDYRLSKDQPCVLILKWAEFGKANRWVKIAENFQQFKDMVGL